VAKSMKLGYGGRAERLKGELMKKKLPGGAREAGAIVGKIARSKGAAPGGPNYHGGRKASRGR
jgi:hypothetical protein